MLHGDGHVVCPVAAELAPERHVPDLDRGGSPLTGTLSVTLRSGTCLGTVVFTEPTNTTLTGVASGTSFDTTNTIFKVRTATAGTYFWRIVFTPTNTSIGGVTKCETSTVTINDAPPP